MSKKDSPKVVLADGNDPEMRLAYEIARANFRYFWREIANDRRRIIPALGMACVKAPFSDGDSSGHITGDPRVEQMWLEDINFDGRIVTGVLINRPNWLKSVKQGDAARFSLDEISDWLYTIGDNVYGAYTVNLLRSRMSRQELQSHDAAWGLNFGDPRKVRVMPEQEVLAMNEALAESLREQLAKNPKLLAATSDHGWTLLHQDALAGSAATVRILLEAGADRNALTDHGMTPLQLAESLGWDEVAALLRDKSG